MLKVLLATAVPPPEHGGINNWTRLVRRQLDGVPDLEMLFVDTTTPLSRHARLADAPPPAVWIPAGDPGHLGRVGAA